MSDTNTELIIFDCDGVLIDSEFIACAVQAQILTQCGYAVSEQEVIERFAGRSIKDIRTLVERESGISLPRAYEQQYHSRLRDAHRQALQPVCGASATINELRDRGYKCCVASGSSPDIIEFGLTLTGLLAMLHPHIFSSSMVKSGKPEPDIFLYAAHQMEVQIDKIVVVEDSVAGIIAARKAGMRAIGFSGGRHCSDATQRRLLDAGAERTIPTMAELLRVV